MLYGLFVFFFENNIDLKKVSNYLGENQFDETNLEWKEKEDGTLYISMPEEQWELVQSIELNMFYDDGEGLIDLGSDNVFTFDDDMNLLGINDRTWLTIDGHYISYYYETMTVDGDNYLITGYSPILYNGQEADLILNFDQDHPYGYIAAIRFIEDTETPNVGKLLSKVGSDQLADFDTGEEAGYVDAVKEGDKIEFLADFYDYEGNYEDQYVLGEAWIVGAEEPVIANMDVGEGRALAMYRFTDIYQKQYWTGVIPEQK